MEWDPDIWELLFSFVFILVGSLTFHISSLISGTSVFREYPAEFSTLMTLTIGIILFGISPVSFLLLGPYLEQHLDPEQGADIRLLVADILTGNTILPFVLSASGLGLLFGASTTLQARVMFLRWIRKLTNMQFGIRSYNLSWDAFLTSLKRGGEISVELEDTLIKGHLKHFSIRVEPMAVWLERYRVQPKDPSAQHQSAPVEGEILIRTDDIVRISAPKYSFNKHHESMRHLSQAFYIVLMAVGLLFLAVSIDGTANFLDGERYHGTMQNIRDAYRSGAMYCHLAAFVMLLTAVKVLREDCSSWRATLDLYPEFLIAITVLAAVFTLSALDMEILEAAPVSKYMGEVALLLAVGIGAVWYYLVQRSRPIKKAFMGIMALDDKTKSPGLADLIEEIYIKTDANGQQEYQYHILPQLLDRKFENFWAMPQITGILDELFSVRPYLQEEMYNFIVKLRLCMKRSHQLQKSSSPARMGNTEEVQ